MIEVDGKYWSGNLGANIHFGSGVLDKSRSWFEGTRKQRFLIVCGQSAVRFNFVRKLEEILKQFAQEVVVYEGISKDPTDDNLREILNIIDAEGIDCIIGLGGGSAIDAAKAASVVSLSDASLEEVLSGKKSDFKNKIYCAAIPTTAGTGAELSKGAILTWTSRQLKVGIRGSLVMPDLAIVDPELTLTVPMKQIRITGFDIFTHAVETFISKKCNPLVANYSLMAIRAVSRFLPLAIKQPDRLDVRLQLSFYSMLMGYNLANSSTCLPHRLQYPLGVKTGTEHAFGLASIYPAWIKMTQSSSEEKFSSISKIISEEIGCSDEGIEVTLRKFMKEIDLTPTLSEMEVSEAECEVLASMVEGALDNDPWWKPGADLAQIYRWSR